jgi:hypothetical protein
VPGVAGLGDLLAVGAPAKPAPGLIRLPASSPSPSATTVALKK